MLKAPENAGGRRSKCPACGHEVYVPTAPSELEELPLAPEDESDRAREQELLEERRRLDQELARESQDAGDAPPARRASTRSAARSDVDVRKLVIQYLLAMSNSNLDDANDVLKSLQAHRDEAQQVIDQIASDQMPPAELGDVPPGVYQGFLKNLRTQL